MSPSSPRNRKFLKTPSPITSPTKPSSAAELGLSGGSALGTAGASAGSGFLGMTPELAAELGLSSGAGSGFVGLSPEFAAELGLEGGSGLGIEGAAGDPLAALEGLDEIANAQYPGDSQYEIQDLQEQARATDVKPGSPTSWDTGESLIPQELKDAANAINKARQVYGIGRSLLGGAWLSSARVGRLYRDWETDRKSTRLNSSHSRASRMPSSA